MGAETTLENARLPGDREGRRGAARVERRGPVACSRHACAASRGGGVARADGGMAGAVREMD